MPPSIPLDDLVAASGGRLLRPTTVTSFSGAAVDSRQATSGCLFVALRGERVDGHRFVLEAAANGAVAALVEQPIETGEAGLAVVEVPDTLHALQELAAWWRGRSAVRVVGITGSTGKTIAKEIVADVLGRTRKVLRNEGNLNSESGLPMTLLQLDADHELAVHPTHLQRAGSIEAITRAKSELPQALPADGLAVLNADDPRVAGMAALTAAAVRTYGLRADAEVRADGVLSHGLAGTEFTLRAPWAERRLRSGSPGRHLVLHALAAIAVAERFAVPMDEVEAALAAGSHADHRMAIGQAESGATLVDDSYNASPVSMAAALDFLAETPLPTGRRRLAVLGDMLELGPDEERLHREIGARAASVADGLLVVGERGAWIGEAAAAAGLRDVTAVRDVDEAIEAVDRVLAPGPGDLVLVKASRGVELDRLVAALEAAR
ncbi:MAG TPA: UDP-N-acetylmuramoyl-tripeptide--D-alanyl-D-alanine ligase [Candidatus Limnocylindria bacterium]|nr:UDP-N-acetylmuramoyl-tripeptide--D-alanyl-D-alanine ligase [Candidatus Limnocylindria bacterium]